MFDWILVCTLHRKKTTVSTPHLYTAVHSSLTSCSTTTSVYCRLDASRAVCVLRALRWLQQQQQWCKMADATESLMQWVSPPSTPTAELIIFRSGLCYPPRRPAIHWRLCTSGTTPRELLVHSIDCRRPLTLQGMAGHGSRRVYSRNIGTKRRAIMQLISDKLDDETCKSRPIVFANCDGSQFVDVSEWLGTWRVD